MRYILLISAIIALSGCHWIGQPAPSDVEAREITAKMETTDEPFAEPGETGGLCGGIAGVACNTEGDYCRKYPGDCTEMADSAGICSPKPQMCTMQYEPICGCDGKTYGNACTAATQGVSISRQGRCR